MKPYKLLLGVCLLTGISVQAQNLTMQCPDADLPLVCSAVSVVRLYPHPPQRLNSSVLTGVQKTVSPRQLKRLRIASVVLSSVAGTLQLSGAGLLLSGVTHPNSDIAFGNELAGAIALYSGILPATGGLGTWIAYGTQMRLYKRQQAMGQF